MRKFFYLLLLSLLLPSAVFAAPPLTAPQGGTGLGSATTTNIGQCLTVSSTAPFKYKFAPCGVSVTTTPQGPVGSVQYNDSGAFNGDSGFTFNSSTDQLSVTNVTSSNITSTNLAVTGVFNFLGTAITNVATWFSGLFDSNLATKSTTNLTEGSNLYYTNARARSSVSSSIPAITYTSSTGVFSLTSGFIIPTTASATQWQTAFSWGNHALAGYLTSYTETDPIWTSASTSYLRLSGGTMTGGLVMTDATSTNFYTDNLFTPSSLTFTNGPLRISYGGPNRVQLYDVDGAIGLELEFGTLTSDQTASFPDKTGTVAFTDDIPTFETDSTPNGTQTLLNLIAGTNVNLTDDGLGGVTIDATGGSGGGSNWEVSGGDLTPTSTIDIALPAGLSIVGHTAFTTATGTSVTSTNANFTTLTFKTAVGTSVTTTNLSVTTNLSLPANSISNTFIRQSAGLSVIGRSANTTGNVADITAASDNQVLRRSGTAIGFGAVNLASTNAVTGLLPFSNFSNGSALSVTGRSANSSGVQASIAGTAGQVLRVTAASVLGFGSLDLQSSAAVSGTLGIINGGTGSNAAIASMYDHIVTSTGSSVWTKPTSTRFIGVRIWAVGGGGGGGGSGTAGNMGAGGGGAGSGYKTIIASSLSATTSVTVGAAGTAGAVGNNDGVAGGTSSFGSHISCTGGGGGNDGGSGGGGGAAGTCTGADLSGSGIAGQSSGAYTDSYRGYGGSAGVDQGFPLSEPSDALSRIIPAGGLLGMYAGAGAARPPSWDANSRTGGSGAYFGAGGSGGQEVGAGGDVAGGAGKQGVVVIQELYQ